MKTANRLRPLPHLSVLLLSLGMLASVSCDSCKEDDSSKDDIPTQTSYTCGTGTHQVGNQCVSNQ